MEEYLFKSSLPTRQRIRKLKEQVDSFEDFKVLLAKEFSQQFVMLYAVDLWKIRGEVIL
jgi:sRNA-binding regulator protein Hfq